MRHLEQTVTALIDNGARTATKFVSDRSVIRASRRRVRGKVPTSGTIEIVLTIGKPNYRERRFIKAAKAAGEKFPVRKVQLRFSPLKRR